METNEQALMILKKANELLTKEAWVKGAMYLINNCESTSSIVTAFNSFNDKKPICMCLVGAVCLASKMMMKANTFEEKYTIEEAQAECFSVLEAVIVKKCKLNTAISVPSFNDGYNTTFQDVKTVLELSIESAHAICINQSKILSVD